jgi:predicted transcriptional regulator
MPSKRKYPESPTAVRFDADTLAWLARTARKNDRTVSWVIRSSIAYARLRDDGVREADAARKAGL